LVDKRVEAAVLLRRAEQWVLSPPPAPWRDTSGYHKCREIQSWSRIEQWSPVRGSWAEFGQNFAGKMHAWERMFNP